ncbi:MAG: ROK family protein [Chloroflexota bacterium]
MTVLPGRRQLEDVRSTNRALLLALARDLRVTTCPALAERSGLSRATAYVIVDELQRAGVLVEAGAGKSNGGRRPQLLRFEPQARFAIGVEMGERDLHTVLVDLDGTVLQREVTVAQGTAPEPVLAAATASIARLLRQAPRPQVLGIGFAAPGLVDIESGVVHTAVGYDWGEVPLAALLQERTGLPVAVANRSKAAALGEFYSGAGVGARLLVYVYIGRGIAAGIVRDGALEAGANSSAGEIGHITIEPAGSLCDCGNRGCLHTLAAGVVLLAQARAQLRQDGGELLRARCGGVPERLTTVQLAEAARDGDSIAAPLVQASGRYLGIAAATVINLFNPDRLILGGPLAAAGPVFLDAVRDEARRRALAVPFSAVQICPSALGSDAGAIGAAALVLGRASDLLGAA